MKTSTLRIAAALAFSSIVLLVMVSTTRSLLNQRQLLASYRQMNAAHENFIHACNNRTQAQDSLLSIMRHNIAVKDRIIATQDTLIQLLRQRNNHSRNPAQPTTRAR